MNKEINKELKHYIEKKIFPIYMDGTEKYNLMHIYSIINHSLSLIKGTRANIDMVYLIASYADIEPLLGTKVNLQSEPALLQWFTNDEILIMEEVLNKREEDTTSALVNVYKNILKQAESIQRDKTLGLLNNYNKAV